MVSGNPNIRNDSQKGYDAEILAVKILEKNGFEIINAPELEKRKSQSELPSTREQVELQQKLENYGYGLYHAEKKKVYTMKDKEILKKFKDVKFTKQQKRELLDLIDEWKYRNAKLESYYAKDDKIKKILRKFLGKSIMPKMDKTEWKKLLQNDPDSNINKEWLKQLENDEFIENSFVDIFCKKGKSHYILDIKHKTFKENINLNRFYVSNYEVLNYDKIMKEKKVKLKIMIILEKDDKQFYGFFNWDDFVIPSSFDPHTKKKTSIRLKNVFDISKLIKF